MPLTRLASVSSPDSNPNRVNGQAVFVMPRWSLVLAAGQIASVESERALEQLCRVYWYPLYAFVRRRGYSPEDAEDLTQGFFEYLLEHNSVSTVSPAKGRFRSFLLASLNNFVSGEWTKAHAQKRGGGKVISLDAHEAETWLNQQPSPN